jgi:hypothetical protein
MFAAEVVKADGLKWRVLHQGMMFSILISHCLPITLKFMGVVVGEVPKGRL